MPAKKVSKTKKTTRKVTPAKSNIKEMSVASYKPDESPSSLNSRIGKKQIIIGGIVIVLLVVLYLFKGLIVAATVNGQPIFRIAVIKELEKQGGRRTLDSLIIQTLILQEAQKKNVTVDQKEIDSEINKIKESLSKQGQNFDQVLAMQGLTQNELVEQIRMQKLVEKMVGKDIKVSDKEINDYVEQNKDAFSPGTTPEQMKVQAKQQLVQKSLSEKIQIWIADLQKNAKVSTFVNY